MQTIERPTPPKGSGSEPPWKTAALIAAGVASLPLLLLAIFNKWGVLVLVIVAVTAGLGIWVWQRGFVLIEVIAFLIHFDGLGFGPIRMGRFVAIVGSLVVLYKIVVDRWRPPAVPLKNWAPVWLMVFWAVLSATWSHDIGTWVQAILVLGLAAAFFAITSMLVDSHRAIQQFLRAYWVGGMFGSAAGILALFLGTRSVGFGADPNYFGLLQASMIPLTIYYRRHAQTRYAQYWYTFAFLVVLAGAAGAGSRSGLIGSVIALVATMVTRPGISAGKRTKVAVFALLLAPIAFLIGFVANPNNLERGFSDRGAGRLDFWTVTVELIREQPLVGHGFGQIQEAIPRRLLVTPGSKELTETRESVSSHNTWLDVTGDLGLIGVSIFISVFAVTVLSLLRPRWPYLKELSTTLFVMLLPVFSSSMFLPLLNNKLAWSIIGFGAALQVGSNDSRWSGMSGAMPRDTHTELQRPVGSNLALMGERESSRALAIRDASSQPIVDPLNIDSMPEIDLARWDLRISARAKLAIAVCALATMMAAMVLSSSLPTSYTATVGIIAPKLDTSVSHEGLIVDRSRQQSVLTTTVSREYATELERLSGIRLDPQQIQERLSVTRPEMGAVIQVKYSDTNESNAKAIRPHMLEALTKVFSDVHAIGVPETANEARPPVPGEVQYYTGPEFLPAYGEAVLGSSEPKTIWISLMAFVAGGLAATGIALAGCRRPRVSPTDDIFGFTGLRAWSHVGGGSWRRTRSTSAQLAQTAVSVVENETGGRPSTRVVIAAPRRGPSVRRLAIGMACALTAQGRRVVLVDAQTRRPLLSLRLAGLKSILGARPSDASVDDLVLRSVEPRRLPPEAREVLGTAADRLRFLSVSGAVKNEEGSLDPSLLERIDDDVTVVVLAPPLNGSDPISPLLRWAQTTLLAVRPGITPTVDAEEAASSVRVFTADRSGIVVCNA